MVALNSYTTLLCKESKAIETNLSKDKPNAVLDVPKKRNSLLLKIKLCSHLNNYNKLVKKLIKAVEKNKLEINQEFYNEAKCNLQRTAKMQEAAIDRVIYQESAVFRKLLDISVQNSFKLERITRKRLYSNKGLNSSPFSDAAATLSLKNASSSKYVTKSR